MHATFLGANGWLLEFGCLRVLVDPWLTGSLEFAPGPWFFQGELRQPQPLPERLDLLLLTQGLPDHDHVLIGRAGGVERDFHLLADELAKALERAREGKGDPSGGRRPRAGNRGGNRGGNRKR